MILLLISSCSTTLCIVVLGSIVDHVSDQTDLYQGFIMRHRPKLHTKVLLCGIVEVRAEVARIVDRCMLVSLVTVGSHICLFFTICSDLLGIENEEFDFSHNNLVCQWILGRDRILLVVARLQYLASWQIENSE